MASLLSMQEDSKKRDKYIQIAKSMGIKVACPNINLSKLDFTPNKNSVLYGLLSIKGVKAAAEHIISYAPYESLEDALARIPKKFFNKTVATNLIKAGAFDFCDTNRARLLNQLYRLRKDKNVEYYDEEKYNKDMSMTFEQEALGSFVTNESEWNKINVGSYINNHKVLIESIKTKKDKNHKTMAFVQGLFDHMKIELVIFSSTYKGINKDLLTADAEIIVSGKKTDKAKMIVNSIEDNSVESKKYENEPVSFNEIFGL